ncbi:MAG: CRTAC1 family protein [Planctomycetaceae bacterium]|nr:CRTAC1 family protein [Planctomycetaceae bacterium]
MLRSCAVIVRVLLCAVMCGCGQTDSTKDPAASPTAGQGAAEESTGHDAGDANRSVSQSGAATRPGSEPQSEPPSTEPAVLFSGSFEPVAESLGLDHIYTNGAQGELLMVESIGAGLGWLDVEQDGRLDLFCVQGGATADTGQSNPSDALYTQTADGRFLDVSRLCGIREHAYGQGVTIGDFNNDGFDDIFVSNVGENCLWQNNGDGTFREVTDQLRNAAARWSSSAAWGDVDRDGDLDLYVCNYLQYDPRDPFPCEKDGRPALCHPRQLPAWADEFFRNNGDGTFDEVAADLGLVGEGSKALGVVIADLNGDQHPDIYVANDTTANFYFLNQGDGKFQESSLRMGGGLNGAGAMQASMGVAAGDYDRNGTLDLFLTHFTGESNTLYRNLGEVGLHDVSGKHRLFPISMSKLGFGTVMYDFDRNGRPDLFVANGHIDSNNADGDGFAQKAQVLSFDGSRWHDVSAGASDYFARLYVGRGVAAGDYDQDGDPDLAILHQNERVELLRNDGTSGTSGTWLTVIPLARQSNRSAIGLQATVTVGGQSWTEFIAGGTSFCSSHEHVLFFGMGDVPATETATLQVTWPNGHRETLSDVSLNQQLLLKESP